MTNQGFKAYFTKIFNVRRKKYKKFRRASPSKSKKPVGSKRGGNPVFLAEGKRLCEESREKKSPEGEFVFYEGPPTANGKPGIHHLEARAFKDAIPRYKTMRGFHVRRTAGWDTHGLPVEIQTEKELGFKSKKDIEEYGVAAFNKKCKESVLRYIEEWDHFTDRIGYWVDKKKAYFTFQNSYIESLWNIVGRVDDQKLLYKDYKVLPWCPRDGTALSSHELAQGYQIDKDLTVYAKFKVKGEENTFLLAWTTTPWTLPGNVALAVGKDIEYVKIKIGEEFFILAKMRLEVVSGEYEIISEMKGSEIVSFEYEPLYPFLKDNLPQSEIEKLPKAFKVYAADFVGAEDGTGIVHIAPMYGTDDFALGTKENLPKYHLVQDDGTFKKEVGFLSGRFVKDEETAVEIIKDLAHRGLLFKKEKYEHSYPHCWRCKTPLIYFARDSWYIKMSSLRDALVSENEKINWEPSYIKEGRFGEWIKDVKDWAISRERYWGTPLPVWMSEDGSEKLVVDSIDALKSATKKSGNTYFLMRHGEAEHNVLNILSSDNEKAHALTDKGREEIKKSAESLKGEKIDLIIHSPLLRAKESAAIAAKDLGVELVEDARLREEDFGDLSGKPWSEFLKIYPTFSDRMYKKYDGAETLCEIRKRVGEFLYDIEKKYSGKRILIITHDGPAKLMKCVAEGVLDEKVTEIYKPGENFLQLGAHCELSFIPIPHDEDYHLDLHKPYIDEVELVSASGKSLKRVKEVMDVWFDSGAMPYAQDHYPFENKEWIEGQGFPADYICEAIDQTRGWFYTLHAVGALTGRGRAYKNVICLGHLNDKDGKKMSKSVGNIVEPFGMIEKYGADALRLWMYSVNQPGEPKSFDEKTVDEIVKKVFNLLTNVHTFYNLYRDKTCEKNEMPESAHVLDRWIMARFAEVIEDATKNLDSYKLLEPVRSLREFIDDLSTWYLQLSRDRFRDNDLGAKETLYFILKNIAKLLAPFAPFYAESLYQDLRSDSDPVSVHLEMWPEEFEAGKDVLSKMVETQKIVSLGLEARAKANVKVRQPLKSLKFKIESLKEETHYLQLVKERVNVKEVVYDESVDEEVVLDTEITPDLREEGMMREVVRAIQDFRKKKDLQASDKISLSIETDEAGQKLIQKFEEEISKTTGLTGVSFSKNEGEEMKVENLLFKFSI